MTNLVYFWFTMLICGSMISTAEAKPYKVIVVVPPETKKMPPPITSIELDELKPNDISTTQAPMKLDSMEAEEVGNAAMASVMDALANMTPTEASITNQNVKHFRNVFEEHLNDPDRGQLRGNRIKSALLASLAEAATEATGELLDATADVGGQYIEQTVGQVTNQVPGGAIPGLGGIADQAGGMVTGAATAVLENSTEKVKSAITLKSRYVEEPLYPILTEGLGVHTIDGSQGLPGVLSGKLILMRTDTGREEYKSVGGMQTIVMCDVMKTNAKFKWKVVDSKGKKIINGGTEVDEDITICPGEQKPTWAEQGDKAMYYLADKMLDNLTPHWDVRAVPITENKAAKGWDAELRNNGATATYCAMKEAGMLESDDKHILQVVGAVHDLLGHYDVAESYYKKSKVKAAKKGLGRIEERREQLELLQKTWGMNSNEPTEIDCSSSQ